MGAGGQGAGYGAGADYHGDHCQVLRACPVKCHVVALLEAGFNWGGCVGHSGRAAVFPNAGHHLYRPWHEYLHPAADPGRSSSGRSCVNLFYNRVDDIIIN